MSDSEIQLSPNIQFQTFSSSSEPCLRSVTESVEALYYPIQRAIEKLALGFSDLCFIRGMPGIGKSFRIRQTLDNLKLEFFEVSGEITEAYLYRVLYQNRNKTIWFKDVVRLLKSPRSIDLLKSACETEKIRTINSYSYGTHNTDLPKQFQFKGKLIFDFNSLTGLRFKEDFEALTTRGDFIDLVFSPQQIASILQSLCVSKEEQEITKFLLINQRTQVMPPLNIRTQRRAFKTAEYAKTTGKDWRDEILIDLDSQETSTRRMLRPLIGDTPIRSSDLKRLLVRNNLISTIRSADRRIKDWIELGEIFRTSDGERNFLVSLRPMPVTMSVEACQR